MHTERGKNSNKYNKLAPKYPKKMNTIILMKNVSKEITKKKILQHWKVTLKIKSADFFFFFFKVLPTKYLSL